MADPQVKGKVWLRGVLEQAMEDVALIQAEYDDARKTADQHLADIRARLADVWDRFDIGDRPEWEFETKVRRVG
jgi:hypothetical protein